MNRTTLILAATITLGGLTLAPSLYAAEPAPANGNNVQQNDNAQQTADVNAVRTLMGNSADAALRENGFNDLVGNFATPMPNPGENPSNMNTPASPANQGQTPPAAKDAANAANAANNANAVTGVQQTQLNDQIHTFRQAFKTKYGEDFAIKDAQTLFGDITASDLNEAQAQPAAAEIKGDAGAANAQTPPPSANTATPAANAGTDTAKNMMQSPQWVTLSVAEYQGAPAVTIRLIRQGDTFRYASVRPVNEQTLATNLTDCLTKVNNDQSHWPADANTAERLVSQHVLGAIQKTQEADMSANHAAANNGESNSVK